MNKPQSNVISKQKAFDAISDLIKQHDASRILLDCTLQYMFKIVIRLIRSGNALDIDDAVRFLDAERIIDIDDKWRLALKKL